MLANCKQKKQKNIRKEIEFGLEIRRKQKNKMMDVMRQRALYIQSNQALQDIHERQKFIWRDFWQGKNQIVTPQIIQNINFIYPKQSDFDEVFSYLRPQKAINILFAAIVASQYLYTNQLFFQKALELIPHSSCFTKTQMQSLNLYAKIQNYQELFMILWVPYLAQIDFQCSQKVYELISHYFFQWWNDESLDLSYQICAKVAICLLPYQNSNTFQQIKFISIELMREDRSYSTYKLVSKLITRQNSKETTKILFLLEEDFKSFLKKGCCQINVLSSCLLIFNQLLMYKNFHKFLEQIIHDAMISVCQVYKYQQKKMTSNLQRNILNTLFNIVHVDFSGCTKILKQINLKQMLAKTRMNNLWDFVDLIAQGLGSIEQKDFYGLSFQEIDVLSLIQDILADQQEQKIRDQNIQTLNMILECIQIGLQQDLIKKNCIYSLNAIIKSLQIQKMFNSQIIYLIERCQKILYKFNEKQQNLTII